MGGGGGGGGGGGRGRQETILRKKWREWNKRMTKITSNVKILCFVYIFINSSFL